MEENAKKIFKILKTKERANDFLIFSEVFDSLEHYTDGVDFTEILKGKFDEEIPDWFQDILVVLQGSKANEYDKDSVLEVIKVVREMIKKAEVVKLEMSFEPSEDFVDKTLITLGKYYIDLGEPGKNILLDFDVKDIGEPGALVYLEGKFLDLTLKNQVLNYLMSEDVINRYL
jgi:hypothetical protein